MTGPTYGRRPSDDELEDAAEDRANAIDDDAADWLAEDDADRLHRD